VISDDQCLILGGNFGATAPLKQQQRPLGTPPLKIDEIFCSFSEHPFKTSGLDLPLVIIISKVKWSETILVNPLAFGIFQKVENSRPRLLLQVHVNATDASSRQLRIVRDV